MSITETTLNTIHSRLQELSNEATPEQLAYLAKAFETIASNGKMIDIVHLSDQKLDELLAKTNEYIESLNDNKDNNIVILDTFKDEAIGEILETTNQNSNLINNLVSTRKPELAELVAQFETVNDVPPGSSILKEIEKEGGKRKFIQDGTLPFIFGILSRGNDSYGFGGFTNELGKWAQEAESADYMLQLLAGCHDFTNEYSGFYKEPSLCFLQGFHGNFILKEQYIKYATGAAMYQYPYAALGAFFIKNRTDSSIASAINFGGSSYWGSGYEGASVVTGIPNHDTETINWQNIYSNTTSSNGFSGATNFVVPANSTIVVILYTSSYYYTNVNNYYSQFIHWYVHSFRSSTLAQGLEIDTEKTLKAWQCKGLSNTYNLLR
jgi:hypothetical protein